MRCQASILTCENLVFHCLTRIDAEGTLELIEEPALKKSACWKSLLISIDRTRASRGNHRSSGPNSVIIIHRTQQSSIRVCILDRDDEKQWSHFARDEVILAFPSLCLLPSLRLEHWSPRRRARDRKGYRTSQVWRNIYD